MAASAVSQTGLYSEKIRDILGMPGLSDPMEKSETYSRYNINNRGIKENISEQVILLKKLLKSNENNSSSRMSVAATMLIATKTLEKTTGLSKLLTTFIDIEKQLKTIAKNQRAQGGYLFQGRNSLASRNPFNRNFKSLMPRVESGLLSNTSSLLGGSLDTATSIASGVGLGTLVSGGAGGGIGAGLLRAGSSALSIGAKVASKAALPLAAAYAAFEGIKGGFNADSVLDKKVDLGDRVQVGLTEATNGLLLGLPDYLSNKVTGKTFSKLINETIFSNPLEVDNKNLENAANLLSLPETKENSKVIGETIGEYLDNYLKNKDKKASTATTLITTTPYTPSAITEGGITPSRSAYIPSATPDRISSVIGKDSKGNNVSIPLPQQAPQLVSKDGQFGYVEPQTSTNNNNLSMQKDPSGKVLSAASQNLPDHQKALLDMLAVGSGKGNYWEAPDYNTVVGGKKFESFAQHPNIMGAPNSTAAGRYQFVKSTWNDVTAKYNKQNPDSPITDFSPENQDKAALFLAKQDYRRRTGRDLNEDLQNPNLSSQEKANLIKQGLGGQGSNTTWEILQKKSSEEIANAYDTQTKKYKNSPEAGLTPFNLSSPEAAKQMGLKDDFNPLATNNVESKQSIYNELPFIKETKAQNSEFPAMPDMGNDFTVKDMGVKPLPVDLPKQDTIKDYTPAISDPPAGSRPSVPSNNLSSLPQAPPVAYYDRLMNSAPSIDNEFSMLAINSTVVS